MITDYHLMTPITVKSPRRGIRTGRGSPPAGGGSWGAARAPAGRGTCCTPRRWRRGPAARCRRPRSPPGCTAQVRVRSWGACKSVCHLAEPDAGQGQVAAHQRHHLHHDVLARGGGEGDHRALAPAHRPHRLVSYHLHRAHASCRAEKITNLPRSTDWCRETRCTAPAGWSWGTWCRHGRTHCPWTAPPWPGSCTE